MCLGSPVAYGEFGIKDVALYRRYLEYFLSESVLRAQRLRLKDASGAGASDYCCCCMVRTSTVVDSAGVVGVCGPEGQHHSDSCRVASPVARGTSGGIGGFSGGVVGQRRVGPVGVAVCGPVDGSSAEGSGVGAATDSAGDASGVSSDAVNVRGRNYRRNKAKRARRRAAKLVEPVGRRPFKADGVEPEGFWNSCSAEVRQQLIDSKAKMHIAENLRRETKAVEEVERMQSPEGLLGKAMSIINMAKEFADRKSDSKVAGWAETVATSYAESIAKSAPSSVPSYASVLSGSAATSVSVDGQKRQRPVATVAIPTVDVGSERKVSVAPVTKVKGQDRGLTMNQIVGRIGNEIAEARTFERYQEIMDKVLDDKRINGFHTNRIVSLILTKQEALRVRAERAN